MISYRRKALEELEAVIKSVPKVVLVSHGKPPAITTATAFPGVYILPEAVAFESRVAGKKLDSYDDTFLVHLIVQTDNSSDDLAWTDIEYDILNTLLNDSQIWSSIIDRDIKSIAYDGYENHPRREFMISVSFKLRENC